MPTAIERPALYYPYIHVRTEDELWLKATLLLHPSVIRMVPRDYAPEDPVRFKNSILMPLQRVVRCSDARGT
jgi:hypothetical protein